MRRLDYHLRTPNLSSPEVAVLTITWGDQEFELYSQRAVHWPATRTLIIADPHFGKAATFRHHGIPVPEGGTTRDLRKLSDLFDITRANRLVILGDFLHARAGRAPAVLSAIDQWRMQHQTLEIHLVRGNHDQHAGDPPAHLDMQCADEPLRLDGFCFAHDPAACRSPRQPRTFAGHIHPCAILHDIDGSSIRSPCFLFTDRVAVLPAFGSFTGMHPVRPRRRKADAHGCISHDRIFAIGPDEVIEVKRMRLARSSRRS
jgi:DNA ligase-associated metallophosphoesterase